MNGRAQYLEEVLWVVLGVGLMYYLALGRPSVFKMVTKVALVLFFYSISAYVAIEVLEGKRSPLSYVLVAPAVLISLVVLVGALLPRSYIVKRAADFNQPPEAIWQVIADYKNFPDWRRGLRRVTPGPTHDGRPTWEEKYRGDVPAKPLTLEMEEVIPNERVLTRFVNPNRGMSGTWTYEISRTSAGTHLRITERGKVYGAVNRVLFRLVLREVGHPKTMTEYLQDLGRIFGEDVTVVG